MKGQKPGNLVTRLATNIQVFLSPKGDSFNKKVVVQVCSYRGITADKPFLKGATPLTKQEFIGSSACPDLREKASETNRCGMVQTKTVIRLGL